MSETPPHTRQIKRDLLAADPGFQPNIPSTKVCQEFSRKAEAWLKKRGITEHGVGFWGGHASPFKRK